MRKRTWLSTKQTLLLGVVVSVISILSVFHMQVELLSLSQTKALTVSPNMQGEPLDAPIIASNTTSRAGRFRPRQKKKSSGGRIDANTPTVMAVYPPPDDAKLPLSVKFRGVAGLGHRLVRQSNAYHLAKGLYLGSLEFDWGWCYYTGDDNNSTTTNHADIASHLFGAADNGATSILIPRQSATKAPQLPLVSLPFIKGIQWRTDDLKKKQSDPKPVTLEFVNEVSHYHDRQYSLSRARRQQPKFYGKDQSDLEMYRTLMQRFKERHPRVQQWKDKLQFDKYTVIGLHIRQGNGEAGDFKSKGRGIQGITQDKWITNLVRLLLNFTERTEIDSNNTKPPMVFLATDSSNATSLVAQLQGSLKQAADASTKNVPKVVTTQQPRIPEGEGVSYQYMFNSKDSCLESWVAQMTDMILLAESNVVIAGQYSSFTQTIPLLLQFAKASERKEKEHSSSISNEKVYPSWGLFCNVGSEATMMECFDDYGDWMVGKSSLSLVGDPNGKRQDSKNLIALPLHAMMLLDMLQRKLRTLPVDLVSLI